MHIYTDAMVDIETTGLSPDRNAILQIAAVKFNYETGVICETTFNRCLHMPAWRSWDQGTAQWWANDESKREILKGILARQEDPAAVMRDFAAWVEPPQQGMRFWSKPTHFDFLFISSYFNDFQLGNPFHYRLARDLNSFIAGLHQTPKHVDLGVEMKSDAHDAFNDIWHQLECLLVAKHRTTVVHEIPDEKVEVIAP